MSGSWDRYIADSLERIAGDGLERKLVVAERSAYPYAVVGGRTLLNLSSNNYLGLAGHPDIVRAEQEAAQQEAGKAASRLIVGHDARVAALEERLAAFHGTEAALVMANGYMANIGALSALLGRGDAVFSDRLNHASIVDGIRLSGAKLHRYRHNDMEHLERLLREADGGDGNVGRLGGDGGDGRGGDGRGGDGRGGDGRGGDGEGVGGGRRGAGRKLIVTDTVFSMDGDIADLRRLVELKERFGAALMVDEAHAGGVFGSRGQGLCEQLGVADRVDLHMGTFSKAFGVYGAYVAGKRDWIRFLVNRCRSFIYTTALPPAAIGGVTKALEIVQTSDPLREALAAKSARFRHALIDAGFDTCGSQTQIVPIVVGDADRAAAFSRALAERGILAVAIRPPTVPEGTARIRFSVMANHPDDELERAAETIRDIGRKLGVLTDVG